MRRGKYGETKGEREIDPILQSHPPRRPPLFLVLPPSLSTVFEFQRKLAGLLLSRLWSTCPVFVRFPHRLLDRAYESPKDDAK